jgi:hypothetical protein
MQIHVIKGIGYIESDNLARKEQALRRYVDSTSEKCSELKTILIISVDAFEISTSASLLPNCAILLSQ